MLVPWHLFVKFSVLVSEILIHIPVQDGIGNGICGPK